jgi:hypothetical protein
LAFAQDHPDVTVLDDRTHMLGTDLRAGKLGSAAAIGVYSPRKWGPFPDIGLVVWPNSPGLSESQSGLMYGACDFGFAFWRLAGIALRSLYFAVPIEALREPSRRPFRADGLLDRRVCVCRASPISRFLWRHWNWAEACRARRANFQYLLDRWTATDIAPLYRELPGSVCPLGFPVRAADRQGLRQRLIARQVFPPIHWVRPAEVPSGDFPQAAALAEEELTIPIDQRYTRQHMDQILEAVGQA